MSTIWKWFDVDVERFGNRRHSVDGASCAIRGGISTGTPSAPEPRGKANTVLSRIKSSAVPAVIVAERRFMSFAPTRAVDAEVRDSRNPPVLVWAVFPGNCVNPGVCHGGEMAVRRGFHFRAVDLESLR